MQRSLPSANVLISFNTNAGRNNHFQVQQKVRKSSFVCLRLTCTTKLHRLLRSSHHRSSPVQIMKAYIKRARDTHHVPHLQRSCTVILISRQRSSGGMLAILKVNFERNYWHCLNSARRSTPTATCLTRHELIKRHAGDAHVQIALS